MLLIAAFYVVIAAGVIYATLGYLFGPLIEAAHRLHAMARKDEPVDFLPVRRHDEIGEIVTDFNSLLKTLREKEEQLRENEALMKHLAYHDALTVSRQTRRPFAGGAGLATSDAQGEASALACVRPAGFTRPRTSLSHFVAQGGQRASLRIISDAFPGPPAGTCFLDGRKPVAVKLARSLSP